MKYHYVYRISNILLNKHYYGVRTSNVEPKYDLGLKYFSSSTDKDFINDQKENSQNYKYKIIRNYKTRKEAVNLEIKLHNKFNVGINEVFYNKSKQTSTGWDTSGLKLSDYRDYTISDETKEKLRKANLGKTDSEETKLKKRNKLLGRPVSEETRNKIGLANSKRKRTEEEKRHLSEINKCKKHTEETKAKISESLKGIDRGEEWKRKISKSKTGVSITIGKVKCDICHREISKNNFKRHKCVI